jgi:transcription initiation factor TFIIE subunit alpha
MAKHPEHLAHLTSAPNEMEAGIIVAALDREGIKATMTGAETSGFRVGVPGEVEILVAQEDLASAQEVLDHAQSDEDSDEDDFDEDFDDDEVFDDDDDADEED